MGGNHYRGVNPYKSSIGPIKYGENKTGHPPGDNWLLYPKFGQLVPGIRLLMIFDSFQDNLLLDKLKSLEYDDYIREKDYIIKSIYYDYLNNDIEIIFNSDSSVLYNARNKNYQKNRIVKLISYFYQREYHGIQIFCFN